MCIRFEFYRCLSASMQVNRCFEYFAGVATLPTTFMNKFDQEIRILVFMYCADLWLPRRPRGCLRKCAMRCPGHMTAVPALLGRRAGGRVFSVCLVSSSVTSSGGSDGSDGPGSSGCCPVFTCPLLCVRGTVLQPKAALLCPHTEETRLRFEVSGRDFFFLFRTGFGQMKNNPFPVEANFCVARELS